MNQDRFIQKLFDERASIYDEWVDGFWTAYRRRVDEEIQGVLSKIPQPMALLDIGCGTGSRLNNLLSVFPAQAFSRICAGDLSSGMIREAKKSLARLPVFLFQGTMEALPFVSQQFDVVLALYAVLGCLTGPDSRVQALQECHRVLKPGGYLIMDVLSRHHRFYTESPGYFEAARRFKEQQAWPWYEGDLLIEKETGRPSLNHGFDRKELVALSTPLFSEVSWRCFDTESGQISGETEGHFLGILRK